MSIEYSIAIHFSSIDPSSVTNTWVNHEGFRAGETLSYVCNTLQNSMSIPALTHFTNVDEDTPIPVGSHQKLHLTAYQLHDLRHRLPTAVRDNVINRISEFDLNDPTQVNGLFLHFLTNNGELFKSSFLDLRGFIPIPTLMKNLYPANTTIMRESLNVSFLSSHDFCRQLQPQSEYTVDIKILG